VVRHANSLSLEEFGIVVHATNGLDPEELPQRWAEVAPMLAATVLPVTERVLVDAEGPKHQEAAPVYDESGQVLLFGEAAA
jgi:hypothetical protein